MTDILLISPELVKDITNIDDNINGKLLNPAIKEAGEALRDIVGDKMFNKITELIDDEEIELPENIYYKTLVDRSQYFLAYTVAANLTVLTYAKVANLGVHTATDEHVQSLSLNDMYQISNNYQQKADEYCYKLQQWILRNRTNLPEITQSTFHEIKSNLHSAASCGVWLGGPRNPKNGAVTKYSYRTWLQAKYDHN